MLIEARNFANGPSGLTVHRTCFPRHRLGARSCIYLRSIFLTRIFPDLNDFPLSPQSAAYELAKAGGRRVGEEASLICAPRLPRFVTACATGQRAKTWSPPPLEKRAPSYPGLRAATQTGGLAQRCVDRAAFCSERRTAQQKGQVGATARQTGFAAAVWPLLFAGSSRRVPRAPPLVVFGRLLLTC